MPKLNSESQKVRFLLVGGSSTVLDFTILFVAKSLGVPVVIANIISTGISFCFSFLANKNYTFRTHGANLKREISLFVVVTLFGLWVLQSIVIAAVLPILEPSVSDASLRLLIAKLLATIVTTLWNYILYSRLVFVHKKPEADEQTE